jgi:hypothetical protein
MSVILMGVSSVCQTRANLEIRRDGENANFLPENSAALLAGKQPQHHLPASRAPLDRFEQLSWI